MKLNATVCVLTESDKKSLIKETLFHSPAEGNMWPAAMDSLKLTEEPNPQCNLHTADTSVHGRCNRTFDCNTQTLFSRVTQLPIALQFSCCRPNRLRNGAPLTSLGQNIRERCALLRDQCWTVGDMVSACQSTTKTSCDIRSKKPYWFVDDRLCSLSMPANKTPEKIIALWYLQSKWRSVALYFCQLWIVYQCAQSLVNCAALT